MKEFDGQNVHYKKSLFNFYDKKGEERFTYIFTEPSQHIGITSFVPFIFYNQCRGHSLLFTNHKQS